MLKRIEPNIYKWTVNTEWPARTIAHNNTYTSDLIHSETCRTKRMKVVRKKTHSFMIIILLLQQLSPFDHAVAATQNNIDDDDEDEHGQCGSSFGELQTESERCRRLLGTKKYISPGALKADQPACGKVVRGEPYSNSCLPPQANRPNRGCNKYYRCRKWRPPLWFSELNVIFVRKTERTWELYILRLLFLHLYYPCNHMSICFH